MTTKLEQAARQALEVLKNQSPDRDMVRAAFALQEALAEPDGEAIGREQLRRYKEKFGDFEQAKQEPVAYDLMTREGCVALAIEKGFERRKLHNSDVEYFVCNDTILRSFVRSALSAPVRTKDLTDDEIAAIVREASRGSAINRDGSTSHRIARAVISAYKEKNK